VADKISEIFKSWGAGRNVLLYGPPATGKTRLISQLFKSLQEPSSSQIGLTTNLTNPATPLSRAQKQIPIPQPVKVVWTTFHQSFGYEDFVLGLRPAITEAGTLLEPWAGVFLDAALELADEDSEYKSVVIFIDEINRGNAARIFGEFMTFLDFDYRVSGEVPIPVPLRQLAFNEGKSEVIRRPGGSHASIPAGFCFPKHVYIVATMNSVDRAAVPIDSALARRFDRIEMRPNLDVLADHWGISASLVQAPSDSSWDTLTPFQTAYLLLDRLNVMIASDLGAEFELGHGLLTSILATGTDADGTAISVSDRAAWRGLAKAWDEVLFPQLEDRFSGRPEQLMDLLHVDNPPANGDFAWTLRTSKAGMAAARTLAPVRVSELDLEVIERSFRWITH
jgi:5-methylcytosine-specific restriction protein B